MAFHWKSGLHFGHYSREGQAVKAVHDEGFDLGIGVDLGRKTGLVSGAVGGSFATILGGFNAPFKGHFKAVRS